MAGPYGWFTFTDDQAVTWPQCQFDQETLEFQYLGPNQYSVEAKILAVTPVPFTEAPLPNPPPPTGPRGGINSTVLRVLTSHVLGVSYSAQANCTNGLPLGLAPGALFAGPYVTIDSTAWTLRTDTSNTPLQTGSGYTPTGYADIVVSFFISGSLGGSSTPPDTYLIYDCYIDFVYANGSTQKWRPTSSNIVLGNGTATNPANAYDADPTTAATMTTTNFASLAIPTVLQLTGFAP